MVQMRNVSLAAMRFLWQSLTTSQPVSFHTETVFELNYMPYAFIVFVFGICGRIAYTDILQTPCICIKLECTCNITS